LFAQLHHFGWRTLVAFPATVPAIVLLGAVRVVVAVVPVPLLVVGNQIVEGESVVRGDVIDALRMLRVKREVVGVPFFYFSRAQGELLPFGGRPPG
jgi:hypothetical protein